MSIKRAIKAKLKNKNNLPEWYQTRKSICETCEYNTKNIDSLSIKDTIRVSHNLGKDACIKCTCGIEDKCSDAIEQCPLEEPKWYAEEQSSKWDYKLENNSKDKVKMVFNNKTNEVFFDYGEIDFQANTDISFNIISDDIKSISVSASCGCTSPKFNKIPKGYNISVNYNSGILGYFNKIIRITINNKNHVARIKGDVIRK